MNFPKQDIFGAVVIYEDSYIHRETIMMKAAKDLGIDLNSQDYDYLCSNIKIFSLYEYEQLMFWDEDVFQLLLKNREERFHWFDFSIIPSNNESKKKLNREIYRVVEDMQDSLVELAENLVGAGLITRN
jgi:alpha-N-acetylglucosamine transferase